MSTARPAPSHLQLPAFLTRHGAVLLMVALCAVLTALYWQGLHGSFLFDDVNNILNNRALRSFDGSWESLRAAAASGVSSPLGRPLSMASFALNFHWFGESAFSFKATNLAIHLLNTILVYVLVLQGWRRMASTTHDQARWPVLWVAAAWALHPIQLTPTLLAVQRMTGLSALFVLLALVLYFHGRRIRGPLGHLAIATSLLVCWPLAVLAKETGVLLPIYLVLCEWLVLGGFDRVPRRWKQAAVISTGGLVLGVCWLRWDFISSGYAFREFTPEQRLMTQTRVLWHYLGLLAFPRPDAFALFHDDITISRGWFTPVSTLLSVLAWLAALAAGWVCRKRQPLLALAVFWFLGAHLLESTLLPLEVAFEHRNYLAVLGPLCLAAALLFCRGDPHTDFAAPRAVLAASFLAFCSLVTALRALQWSDEFERTQIEAATHPQSARANYDAAVIAMQRTFESGGGNPIAYQMVQFYFQRAAELEPLGKAALLGMMYLDCTAGMPKNRRLLEQAITRFGSTPFRPGDQAVLQSLSDLLAEGRLCVEPEEFDLLLQAGLSNPAATPRIRGMLHAVAMDHALSRLRDPQLALAYARQATAADPSNVALRANLAHMHLQQGRLHEARREYEAMVAEPLPPQDRLLARELKQRLDATEANERAN